MALAYYRFFPGDYARDTRHLSMMQQGAYRQLIDEYMVHGPLPNDLQRLYRICSAFSAEERAAVEYVLGEFFLLNGPVWHHKRCDRERSWQESKSEAARESSQASWESRRNTNAKRTLSERKANQNQNQNQNHIPEPKPSLGDVSPKTPLLAQAREILAFLNEKTGKTFRDLPANTELICNRLKDGSTVQECKSMIAKKCRDWRNDDKMREFLRPKTLFGKTNFANYLGELNAKVS